MSPPYASFESSDTSGASLLNTTRCWTPSQNTLILLNKNLKIYKSVVDKEVNIGQKANDFPMVSQAACA